MWDFETLPLAVFQGDIVSCAGCYLYLWTVNGQLLASTSTACSPSCHILTCCFAEVMDWDTRSIIVTGSTDGVVRVGGWEGGKGIQIHCSPDIEFFILNRGTELLKTHAAFLTVQKRTENENQSKILASYRILPS